MRIYFLTTNPGKIAEAQHYCVWRDIEKQYSVEICIIRRDIQEILHKDVRTIVRQKAVDAYEAMRHPCVVEHGGLFMDALPGLLGGIGKIVWDAVSDRMCGFLREGDTREATARSFLGFCDGRRVRRYEGETRGRISDQSRGANGFAWDPIFMPENSEATYGEMDLEEKRNTSPSFKAWDAFLAAESPRFKALKGPQRGT